MDILDAYVKSKYNKISDKNSAHIRHVGLAGQDTHTGSKVGKLPSYMIFSFDLYQNLINILTNLGTYKKVIVRRRGPSCQIF